MAMLDTLTTMLEEQRQDVLLTRETERKAAAEAQAAAQEAMALAQAEVKAAKEASEVVKKRAARGPLARRHNDGSPIRSETPVKDTATAALLGDFGDGDDALSLGRSEDDDDDGASLASDLSELQSQ